MQDSGNGFRCLYKSAFVRFSPNINVSWSHIVHGSGVKSRTGHVPETGPISPSPGCILGVLMTTALGRWLQSQVPRSLVLSQTCWVISNLLESESHCMWTLL